MIDDIQRLIDRFKEINLDEKNILDLFSIKHNIRQFCLVHIEEKYLNNLESLIKNLDLELKFNRKLYLYKDDMSHETILLSKKKTNYDQYNIRIECWVGNNSKFDDILKNKIIENPGYYLGYPDCCITKYEGVKSLNDHYYQYLFLDKSIYWQNNRLPSIFSKNFFFPDFFPCSLNCENAKDFNSKFITLSKLIFSQETIEDQTNIMKTPIFIKSDSIFFPVSYINNNKKIFFNKKDLLSKKLSDVLTHKKQFNNRIIHCFEEDCQFYIVDDNFNKIKLEF